MFDGNILRAFATLGLLVSLFGVLFWLIKKYTAKSKKKSSGISLEILSRMALQPKNQLFVIKAGDKTLLLGVSEKSINTLADLSSNVPSTQTFDNVLMQTQNKNTNSNQIQNIDENSLSFKSFLMSTLSKSN